MANYCVIGNHVHTWNNTGVSPMTRDELIEALLQSYRRLAGDALGAFISADDDESIAESRRLVGRFNALEECFACIPPAATPTEPTLAELLANRDAWCLVWREPWSGALANGEPEAAHMQLTATVESCLRMRRWQHFRKRGAEDLSELTDEDMLADFIAVNWARAVPVRREGHEIGVESVGGTERPDTGTDPLRTSLD